MQTNFEKDTKEVYAVVNKLSKLMIARDTSSMTKILDEDFTLTHITGYVQPKAEWLNEVEKESMKYFSAIEVNHEIKIAGNTADVMFQSLIDARIWGSRNIWRLQQKMKLEKRNGTWIILSSIASTF